MTPSEIALANQDILHHTFSLGILDQHDLHACCLVNSEWAATGLILLWHYPKCHTLHSFTQLLHTLRHEIDLPGPVVSLSRTPLILADIKHHNSSKNKHSATTTTTPATTAISPPPPLDPSVALSSFSRAMSIRRSSTMRERTSPRSALSHSLSQTPSVSSSFLVPTPYRPIQRREYGIPFHGQRIYHRGQLIRGIDFNALTDSLTLHHFEILARSTRIGFRTLDLRKVRFPFSENLLAILVACTSLKELSLRNIHIPLRAIEFLEPCFSTLTELRLNDCPDAMDDEELTPILRSCSQVKLLEIQGESFTDVSLNWIGTTCLQLESLMVDAPLMTDKTVRHIATNCKKIRHWRLINCLKLEDETTETLEEIYTVDPRTAPLHQLSRETGHFPSLLQTNKLVDAVFSTASGASHTAASSVSATSSTVSSPSTTSISGHSDLDHPSSSQFPFDHHLHQDRLHPSFALDRYSAYASLRSPIGKLTSLELRNCNSIRPETIDSLLKSQTALEHLVLGGISITEEALESFTQTPQDRLRSLSLLNCGEISDETMMAVMFNCEHLTKLRIYGSHFTLRTFSSISMHLVKLEELHLEHVPLIMNESLQDILVKCTYLRSLKLWHCRNLTHDLFTDISTPCYSLEVLEYMDKHPRPYIGDGWAAQVKFLQSIVIRFESLRVLKLTKLGDTVVPVPLNLVSYLCQLDRLESFTILQNPRIDFTDLNELATNHRTLLHVGVGPSKSLTEQQVNSFNDSKYQPCVRIYKRSVDSSEELERYMT